MIDASTNMLIIYQTMKLIYFFYKIYLNLFIKLICYLNSIIETIYEEVLNVLVWFLQVPTCVSCCDLKNEILNI